MCTPMYFKVGDNWILMYSKLNNYRYFLPHIFFREQKNRVSKYVLGHRVALDSLAFQFPLTDNDTGLDVNQYYCLVAHLRNLKTTFLTVGDWSAGCNLKNEARRGS